MTTRTRGVIRDPGRIKSLKGLPLVEVTWFDAASSTPTTWVEYDATRKQRNDGLMECQTTGYLVKLSPRAVIVCMTRAENGKVGADWSIPRVWIKNIRKLK